MAIRNTHTQQSIGEYYAEMSEMIGMKALKALRISYVATVILAAYYVAVRNGADPQTTLPWIVGSILLVTGVEIAELEALRKLTNLNISFSSDNK